MPTLTLTDTAESMISELVDRAGLPPGSGLRIARAEKRAGLRMALSERPAPGDVVVAAPRAVIYLDDAAAERLSGHRLDARRNEQGAAFFLRP
jgi:Fe-S cluster assembly iron-binding protein IscA